MFFLAADFSGLGLSKKFFSPSGKVEKSHINKKATTVVLNPLIPLVRFLLKKPRNLGIETLRQTRSRRLHSTRRCHRRATRTSAASVPLTADALVFLSACISRWCHDSTPSTDAGDLSGTSMVHPRKSLLHRVATGCGHELLGVPDHHLVRIPFERLHGLGDERF